MNYIQHLLGFLNKLSSDDKPNPTHVSLYLALFHQWNLTRFENPISINRSSTMRMSKIGSQNTYHKCLHDLDCWGYISYRPSHNPTKGSKIYMFSFDTTDNKTCSDSIQALGNSSRKNDTSTIQALRSSINNINIKNNKTILKKKTHSKKIEKNKNSGFSKSKTTDNPKSEFRKSTKRKRKKVAPKKEKTPVLPVLVLPFTSERFVQKCEVLLNLPKWRKKPHESLKETLTQLKKYPEEFAIELVELAISGNYQAVIYPNTPQKFEEWKSKTSSVKNANYKSNKLDSNPAPGKYDNYKL